MAETTLVGVRVHSWQWFKFCKWAELSGLPLGVSLSAAIQEYLALQKIPQETLDKWLVAYHQEAPVAVD